MDVLYWLPSPEAQEREKSAAHNCSQCFLVIGKFQLVGLLRSSHFVSKMDQKKHTNESHGGAKADESFRINKVVGELATNVFCYDYVCLSHTVTYTLHSLDMFRHISTVLMDFWLVHQNTVNCHITCSQLRFKTKALEVVPSQTTTRFTGKSTLIAMTILCHHDQLPGNFTPVLTRKSESHTCHGS